MTDSVHWDGKDLDKDLFIHEGIFLLNDVGFAVLIVYHGFSGNSK